MTKRLDDAMTRLRSEGVTGVIPYVTIGFPSLDDTLSIVPALEEAGASVIELGVPYSDPLADGPTIHAASHRALEAGINSHQCVDVVQRLREAGVTAPLLFMGYYNPILSYGPERYARDCAAAGLDGLMIPDLPPEESGPLRAALAEHDLALMPNGRAHEHRRTHRHGSRRDARLRLLRERDGSDGRAVRAPARPIGLRCARTAAHVAASRGGVRRSGAATRRIGRQGRGRRRSR